MERVQKINILSANLGTNIFLLLLVLISSACGSPPSKQNEIRQELQFQERNLEDYCPTSNYHLNESDFESNLARIQNLTKKYFSDNKAAEDIFAPSKYGIEEICSELALAQTLFNKRTLSLNQFVEVINTINTEATNATYVPCKKFYFELLSKIDEQFRFFVNHFEQCRPIALLFSMAMLGMNVEWAGIEVFAANQFSPYIERNTQAIIDAINVHVENARVWEKLNIKIDEFTGERFYTLDSFGVELRRPRGIEFDFGLYSPKDDGRTFPAMYISYFDVSFREVSSVYLKNGESIINFVPKPLVKDTYYGYSGGLYFYGFEQSEEIDFLTKNLDVEKIKVRVQGELGKEDRKLTKSQASALSQVLQAFEFIRPDPVAFVGAK